MWERISTAETTLWGWSPGGAATERVDKVEPAYSITVEGAGGEQGWRLNGGSRLVRSAERTGSWKATVELHPLAAATFPQLSESYVRGQDLILNYVQQESDRFGISLQVTPIEISDRGAVIQLTLSLQTDLLDSHPALELVAAAEEAGSPEARYRGVMGPRSLPSDRERPIFGGFFLSPRDQMGARDLSDEEALRLQLFGSFLEKGVIRKSRPWVVLWRERPPQPDEIGAIYRRLCQRPLPLTT